MESPTGFAASAPHPRVVIKFCTQCKWMLRAAYFAQELLSTFSTDLGEVALQPATGGVFSIEIFYTTTPSSTTQDENGTVTNRTVHSQLLWDRKTEGGFPETKEIKRRIRDIIDPGRDLGHVDGKKKAVSSSAETPTSEITKGQEFSTPQTLATPEGVSTPQTVSTPQALSTPQTIPTSHVVPTHQAGSTAPEVSLRDFIAAGAKTGDVNSSGRGGAEEELLEHEEKSLEAQPGGGRYQRVARDTGNMEDETGTKGVVCDTTHDERKRNPDGTICEDCY